MLDIDLQLQRGQFNRRIVIQDDERVVALVGASGAGKTTVLNAIAGLVRPQAGHIRIDGRCLYDHQQGVDLPTHRRRIGYVFQDARLFPHLDVRRNLDYGRVAAAAHAQSVRWRSATRGDRPRLAVAAGDPVVR